MKLKAFFSIFIILFIIFSLLSMPTRAWAATTTSILTPVSYTTINGSDGGQSVDNLSVLDQSGPAVSLESSVEFQTPEKKKYDGYRSYSVPGSINVSSITGIQVKANFLGQKSSKQKWTWSIYNWSSHSWTKAGTNSGGSWSAWKNINFKASGKMPKYVSPDGEIRIRLQSSNATDNAYLDYESVTLSYTVPPTSVPTPTTAPTTLPAGDCTHFVSTAGNDGNNGMTVETAWKTIQKAANSAGAGNVVCVRGGTYVEKVTVNVSGAPASYITFQNYPGEYPVLDGTGITVPASENGMVYIKDRSFIIFRGFEIRNYKTSAKDIVPIGIRITGIAHDIEIRDNKIHNIEHNGSFLNGTDAHGIAVHGTSGTTPVMNIVIEGNELYDLKLGSSEALVLNGNVDGWQVNNNTVHDANNIAIVAIGFEGTASSNDQARNGVIRGNHVYNIDSFGNPAYGSERSAGGIYVDGGTGIVIEQNRVHTADIGIELASEHSGKATSNVTVRNNFIYNNLEAGISIGGYDTARGSTINCKIVNNTLFNNASLSDAWGSELNIQYDTRNNIIKNNIFYAKNGSPYILSWSKVMTSNVMDNNLFFNSGGAGGTWQWKNLTYSSFENYQAGSGNDTNSLNNSDPLFVSTGSADLHLQAGSPAVNSGVLISEAGSLDIDGQERVVDGAIDLGADEIH